MNREKIMLKNVLSLYLAVWLLLAGVIPIGSAWGQGQSAKKRYTLAVINLDAKGVSQVESDVLSEKLRSHLLQVVASPQYAAMKDKDQYELVERTQMDKIFDQFNIQNTGCVSDSCAVELGKMLQADRILIGQVGLVGKTYSVSARIVDVGSSRTIRTADRQYKGSIDDVMNSVIIGLGDDLLIGKVKKSKTKWYLIAGAVIAGGGAAAAMGGGGGGGGGGVTSLPLPPSRP